MPTHQDWKQTLSTRNLTVDDMYNMSIDDREKYIQKQAVWKKPDYQQLVSSGTLSRDAAYLLKCVYDAIPAKPADGDRIKQQRQWHEERKNYITFVAGVRDAMQHVRTADDMQKALQTVMIDNGFATKQGIMPAYKQCGARKVALALLMGPEKVHDEALKKMFCVPEKDQARMYFNCHRFMSENCEFKEVNGTPVLAVHNYDGERHYTIPNNTRGITTNPEDWQPGSFFLTRNGMVFANNFESPTAAQEEATKFGLHAVQTAKMKGNTITPSKLPPLYIPEVVKEEPVVEEHAVDTEEILQSTEPVIEEPIFIDDPVITPADDVIPVPSEPAREPITLTPTPVIPAVEVAAENVVEAPKPSIAEEIKRSLQDAIEITKPVGFFGEDPLEPFHFRNGSFYDELTAEQQQDVLREVVPAFTALQNALDLPAEGISFGGNMALTFNESPQKIATSYNMQTDTLNLAKLKDTDLLAMQWFRGLDLALGEQTGFFSPLSEQPYKEIKAVAPEFAKLIKTALTTQTQYGLSESNYLTASKDFDAATSDKARYWQNVPNMLSRAFACFITDKTAQSSQFLSGFSEMAGPIPEKEERTALNKQFEAVLAEAKQLGVFTLEPAEKEIVAGEPKRQSLEELITQAGAPTVGDKHAGSKSREDR